MGSINKVTDVKWNSNDIITFFEIYQKFDCLWDASSASYLKRDVKNAALESVRKELMSHGLKISLAQLKIKIKSLRDTYRNEINKVKKSKKSGAAAEDIYKPKLAWFSTADAFLSSIFIGRNSSSNLDLETPEASCYREDWNDLETPSTSSCNTNETTAVSSGIKNKRRSPKKMCPPSPRSKFARTGKGKAAVTRLESTINKLHDVAQLATDVRKDQYEKFGSHIAAQLRELPLRSFLILQTKIQDIISTERLSCLDDMLSPRIKSYLSDSSLDIKNVRDTSTPVSTSGAEPLHIQFLPNNYCEMSPSEESDQLPIQHMNVDSEGHQGVQDMTYEF